MTTMLWRFATGLLLAAATTTAAAAAPLAVDATLPDLGSLVREVGGNEVEVTVFTKGMEDPHFVEARPSFIKALSEADLLVLAGLDVEIGWLPVLLQNCRNANVLPGGRGYLDASTAIRPLDVPTGVVDRSMGDIHAFGNPHYLTDPLNGLRVAALIRDRLAALRPEKREDFAARYEAFRRRLGERLVGERLAAKYEFEKLATLYEYGKLDEFLRAQGDEALLGGWLGALRPFRGMKAVDDHPMWSYFAHRFGLDIVGHLEPKPGIPPTTRHLADLIALMRAQDVRLILAAAYYDPRHARFVAEQTGARVALMANLVGSRPGTDDYLAMIDYDVRQIATASGGSP
jgi:ABC-type Zn uptake system ZnuABC Zn-binding protein ZnuA